MVPPAAGGEAPNSRAKARQSDLLGSRGPKSRIAAMIQAKQELLQALAAALGELAPDAAPAAVLESPKQASHGDFAVTAAMALARSLKAKPRELAQRLIDALHRQPAVQ